MSYEPHEFDPESESETTEEEEEEEQSGKKRFAQTTRLLWRRAWIVENKMQPLSSSLLGCRCKDWC